MDAKEREGCKTVRKEEMEEREGERERRREILTLDSLGNHWKKLERVGLPYIILIIRMNIPAATFILIVDEFDVTCRAYIFLFSLLRQSSFFFGLLFF